MKKKSGLLIGQKINSTANTVYDDTAMVWLSVLLTVYKFHDTVWKMLASTSRFYPSEPGDKHHNTYSDPAGYTDCGDYLWCGSHTLVADQFDWETEVCDEYLVPTGTWGVLPASSTPVLPPAWRGWVGKYDLTGSGTCLTYIVLLYSTVSYSYTWQGRGFYGCLGN